MVAKLHGPSADCVENQRFSSRKIEGEDQRMVRRYRAEMNRVPRPWATSGPFFEIISNSTREGQDTA
jgi:hypothetical protein